METRSLFLNDMLKISDPALLFPAISLLLLAFTNRFLGLAAVVRSLHSNYKANPEPHYLKQIHNLRVRLRLIRDMQVIGVLSLLLCTTCMFLLFWQMNEAAYVVFCASLVAMITSLALSIAELVISVGALNVHLSDIEEAERNIK